MGVSRAAEGAASCTTPEVASVLTLASLQFQPTTEPSARNAMAYDSASTATEATGPAPAASAASRLAPVVVQPTRRGCSGVTMTKKVGLCVVPSELVARR
ncbi:MAG: hypothetical protein BWX86_01344 [Verrucomicrobia bacterium ADurb.Bin122]|nr:MAG: hypothetical protein BWX86_01344 [Verrucomicrobia bacterium ADurb.Bin122]